MIRTLILTISDRSYRKVRDDITGPALMEEAGRYGFCITGYEILPDEMDIIRDRLIAIADKGEADLVLTAGGTGFAERDTTPEATAAAAERLAPGIAEAIRAASMAKTKRAMLSRGIAAIRKRTLVINLPGSPAGAVESFAAVADTIGHGIELMKGEKPDG